MAYETKSLFKMLYLFAEHANTKEEILDFIREAANSEGVIIPERNKEEQKPFAPNVSE